MFRTVDLLQLYINFACIPTKYQEGDRCMLGGRGSALAKMKQPREDKKKKESMELNVEIVIVSTLVKPAELWRNVSANTRT